MKYLITLTLVIFCLSSVTCGITFNDTAAIQNSSEALANGFSGISKINVSVLPPDGVIYNITTSSELNARLIGIITFSNLTYYYPEVTYGWIGIFSDNTIGESKPVFFDIYYNDLNSIVDRKNTSQSEAFKIANDIINKRGTSSSISKRTVVPTDTQSTKKSTITSKKSTTSYSSHSSDCERVYVKGHYRNGKWVNAYYRNKPGCG